MHLQGFVVAGPLHIFTDDQIFTKARFTTLQNADGKKVGGQAVAAQTIGVLHRGTKINGGAVQAVLVAQPPNMVIASFPKHSKVEIGLIRRRENAVVGAAHHEQVRSLKGVTVVTKGNEGTVFCGQTRLRIRLRAGSEQCPSIARRNFTGFTRNRHRLRRDADTTLPQRGDGVQGRPARGERNIVGNGQHLIVAIAKTLNIDGCAQKDIHHLRRIGVEHSQTHQRLVSVRKVGEAYNLWTQVGAKKRLSSID